jgi:small subunit ribosomal protein S9
MAPKKYFYALGKRKTAVAEARLFATSGHSKINDVPFDSYVKRSDLFSILLAPLKAVNAIDTHHFEINVSGSGETAQVGAMRLALARALILANPSFRKVLKDNGFLTRDSRIVERKKPGLHKARKDSQWSKR